MREKYPRACWEVDQIIFVDDVVTGTTSKEETVKLCEELQYFFKNGGWNITKFASNSQRVISQLPMEKRIPGLIFNLDGDDESKGLTSTLGL